jgi:hypothetical protein
MTVSLGCFMPPFILLRHCEERSDEAIQKRRIYALDCFAALAMTVSGARSREPSRVKEK